MTPDDWDTNSDRDPSEDAEAWLLITGNPVDGFAYFGPFPTHEDAMIAGERDDTADWWIAPLRSAQEAVA